MTDLATQPSSRNLQIRLIAASILLSIYYFWLPMLFMPLMASTNNFYSNFNFSADLLTPALIATLLILLLNFLAIVIFSKAHALDDWNATRKVNERISNASLAIVIALSAPLFYGYFFLVFDSRNDAFSYISNWRHHALISAVFTIALATSGLAYYLDGSRRNLILLFIFGVLPELLYGTRISAFRFGFLLIILATWRPRTLLLLSSLVLAAGFSRLLFKEYGHSSLYHYVMLFLGDPINILLGSSFLAGGVSFSCGVDGLHFVRTLLPPIPGWRDAFSQFAGDVTICINDHGFGVGAPHGLGGSPINDIFVAPLSLASSSLALVIFLVICGAYFRKYPIVRYLGPLISISCAPYIMRNGLIATSNHIITVTIWVLVPMVIAEDFLAKRWNLAPSSHD